MLSPKLQAPGDSVLHSAAGVPASPHPPALRVLPASISSPKTALNPISLHIPLVQIAFHPSKYTILISFHKVVCSLTCCWWDLRAHGEGTKVSPGKTGWGGAEGDAWSLIVPDGPKNPENTKEVIIVKIVGTNSL